MNFDNTYVKIDLDVIEANFTAIREKAGVDVMAVVKADAYGHGAVQVTRLLQDKCPSRKFDHWHYGRYRLRENHRIERCPRSGRQGDRLRCTVSSAAG